jgi:protein-disulfide isomerase
MDWKKNSWIFSLAGLIILAFAIANSDRFLGSAVSANLHYNFTNNPDGIVVEMYSDFACPFCNQARTELHSLLDKHNGNVNFLFRHLIVHPETEFAAEASECARDQGRFMEYADILYARQSFDTMSLKQYAEDLGLDMERFENCLSSHEKGAVLQRDYEDAVSRSVRGTPTFFVDGKQVPLEYLDLAIEEAINVRAQS